MQLPEKEWFTIDDLARRWGTDGGTIEHYFETRKLKVSLRLPQGVELLEVVFDEDVSGEKSIAIPVDSKPEPATEGIYDIIFFGNIGWDVGNSAEQCSANLAEFTVYLKNPVVDRLYSVAAAYRIKKNDLIVTSKEVNIFEQTHIESCTLKHDNLFSVVPSLKDKVILSGEEIPSEVSFGGVDDEPVANTKEELTLTHPANKVRPPQLDATGRMGALKTLILGGLQDFYEQNKRMPAQGNAFQEFLCFIYNRYNTKPKPEYFAHVVGVSMATMKTEMCISVLKKKSKDSYKRKYVESRYYAFQREFLPNTPPHP